MNALTIVIFTKINSVMTLAYCIMNYGLELISWHGVISYSNLNRRAYPCNNIYDFPILGLTGCIWMTYLQDFIKLYQTNMPLVWFSIDQVWPGICYVVIQLPFKIKLYVTLTMLITDPLLWTINLFNDLLKPEKCLENLITISFVS